jgi:hypothetical protein
MGQISCALMLALLWTSVLSVLNPTFQAFPPSGESHGGKPISSITGMRAGPAIYNITTNASDYPSGQIPRYEKFEITFQVDTIAENPQLPYDPIPPSGIKPGIGITVDALFTPDNWQTVYTQPAFYYQEFEHMIKEGKDWIYPTGRLFWKVRFAPHRTGCWQFKLIARDASGTIETSPQPFTVTASNNKGFLRVSKKDPRYFEFENGEFFIGLGYNLTYGELDWNNPILTNEPYFQKLHEYGLQLFRTWLSHWGIFTSAWNAWNSPLPERHGQYIPYVSLRMDRAYPGSEVSMVLTWKRNPGMMLGFMKQSPAVKQNTHYHLFVRYLIPQELKGPRIAGYPYGLVAKTGGWLTGPGSWPDNIYGFVDPGTGTIVSSYVASSPVDERGEPQWSILEGEIYTGNKNFLPNLYLVLENIIDGTEQNGGGNIAYIDRVELREDLGNGQYGPNIISQPWMAHHLYMDQRNSYAFDQILELAKQYDLYLKLVISEKNEWILDRFDYDGNPIFDDPRCSDQDPANDPAKCPGSNPWFYGNGRQMTKVRWLQQAWWRYLQARWGYSTQIHSWELLNEGDPFNELHYTLADEFGKFMHQFTPNDHLVTTSFWHSFPRDQFWANTRYPNVDYADLHAYAMASEVDTAENTRFYSEQYGAKQPKGAGKPLIRGETGFSDEVLRDTTGVWLHNYIWGTINPGGMYEQYWYAKEHIVQASQGNDLRYHYKAFRNFIEDIPLNNGFYQDAQAVTSLETLRAWGQKDLVHGHAHLWIQNRNHHWRNVIDHVPISPVTGTVSLAGFRPTGMYRVEWWDPYQPDKARQILRNTTVIAQSDGTITFMVENLATDIAVKITGPPATSQGPETAILAGVVEWEGRGEAPAQSWAAPLQIWIQEVEVDWHLEITTTVWGEFIVSGLIPGTYTIGVKGRHTLQVIREVELVAGINEVRFGTLREGDANGDNRINVLDFSALASGFGKCQEEEGYRKEIDFNEDGCADEADFSLLARNFGMVGEGEAEKPAKGGGSATLYLEMASEEVKVGEPFWVKVIVESKGETIDGVGVFLRFDPEVLRIVGIEQKDSLPVQIWEGTDARMGWAGYVAGVLGDSLQGRIEVVAWEMEAVGNREETALWLEEESDVAHAGLSVLEDLEGELKPLIIHIKGQENQRVHLPLLMR